MWKSEFPSPIGLSLAMAIRVERDAINDGEHKADIRVKQVETDEPMLHYQVTFSLELPPEGLAEGEDAMAMFATPLFGAFPAVGAYRWEIDLDDGDAIANGTLYASPLSERPT